MAKGFQIADLSQEEKEKLSQVEKEIGKVLIAWEKKEDERNNQL